MDAEPKPWLEDAVALWLKRALRRSSTATPLTDKALAGEVRQWKPAKLPPGVSSKEYTKAVLQGLKADARLRYCPPTEPGGSGVFLSADAGGAVVSPAPAPAPADGGAGSAPPPPAPALVFRSSGAAPPTPPPANAALRPLRSATDKAAELRPLRSATDEAAELHAASLAATFAEVTSMAPAGDSFSDADSDDGTPAAGSLDAVRAYFADRGRGRRSAVLSRGYAVADGERAGGAFAESALLGHLRGGDGGCEVHLNTHEPFCLVAVGVQGGGKSHSWPACSRRAFCPSPRQVWCASTRP